MSVPDKRCELDFDGLDNILINDCEIARKGRHPAWQDHDPRSDPAISKARLILSRVDHPEWFIETDPETEGTFEFIFSSRPMHFSVTAPGFKTWNYEDSIFSKNRTPLTVLPESTNTVKLPGQ
jgi:hypothetical protein